MKLLRCNNSGTRPHRGCSSSGRALVLPTRGNWFESFQLHAN